MGSPSSSAQPDGASASSAGLPPLDHADRVDRVRARLDDCDEDAFLFTDLTDVRWLTGFTGSNGWAVLTADRLTLATDGRYRERARAECAGSGAEVVAEQSRPKLDERLVAALSGAARVGLDETTATHAEWKRLSSLLAPATALVARSSAVATQRRVKDAAEVARIAAAAACTDAALAEVEPLIRGALDHAVTEADLRNELEYRMRLHGADDRSYDTIVASGPDHAARPHHEVTRRTLLAGDTLIIDVGALVDGYHSDMTRSWVIGEPSAEQREWYDLVARAQAAGLAALAPAFPRPMSTGRAGTCSRAAGVDQWFVHGTGHAVGLVIHEAPFHGPTSSDTIEAGNVVTVEPGLYRVGFGGFRIEDLVVVDESGHQVLTHTPQRPFAP